MHTSTTLTVLQRLSLETKRRSEQARLILSASPKLGILMGVIGIALLTNTDTALAGQADNGEFDNIWDTLTGWTQGTLGRIIALTLIVVGACMGVVRQSLMTFVVGISMGLALYNAPTIIENVMTATLHAPYLVEGAIGNGLN